MKLKELLAPMDEHSKVSLFGDRFKELSKAEAISKYGDKEVQRFFPDSYRLHIKLLTLGHKTSK